VKEKRPTISPNFNFLGQLLDFEKKIKNQSGQPGHISKLKLLHLEKSSEHVLVPEGGQSSLATSQLCITATSEIVESKPADPGSVPCTHLPSLEDSPLVQGINGLHVSLDKVEDSNRLKRSFSLDIKSVSYSAASSCVTASVQGFTSSEDTLEYYKHATALEGSSKLCQFSPVQEVSEQTPEASPDKEEANPPKKPRMPGSWIARASGSTWGDPAAVRSLSGRSCTHCTGVGAWKTTTERTSCLGSPPASSTWRNLRQGWASKAGTRTSWLLSHRPHPSPTAGTLQPSPHISTQPLPSMGTVLPTLPTAAASCPRAASNPVLCAGGRSRATEETPGGAGTRRALLKSSLSAEAARWSLGKASYRTTDPEKNWGRWAVSRAFQAAWKSLKCPEERWTDVTVAKALPLQVPASLKRTNPVQKGEGGDTELWWEHGD